MGAGAPNEGPYIPGTSPALKPIYARDVAAVQKGSWLAIRFISSHPQVCASLLEGEKWESERGLSKVLMIDFSFLFRHHQLWFFHCHIEWHLQDGLALVVQTGS